MQYKPFGNSRFLAFVFHWGGDKFKALLQKAERFPFHTYGIVCESATTCLFLYLYQTLKNQLIHAGAVFPTRNINNIGETRWCSCRSHTCSKSKRWSSANKRRFSCLCQRWQPCHKDMNISPPGSLEVCHIFAFASGNMVWKVHHHSLSVQCVAVDVNQR